MGGGGIIPTKEKQMLIWTIDKNSTNLPVLHGILKNFQNAHITQIDNFVQIVVKSKSVPPPIPGEAL